VELFNANFAVLILHFALATFHFLVIL
jgi:hypothetical protein